MDDILDKIRSDAETRVENLISTIDGLTGRDREIFSAIAGMDTMDLYRMFDPHVSLERMEGYEDILMFIGMFQDDACYYFDGEGVRVDYDCGCLSEDDLLLAIKLLEDRRIELKPFSSLSGKEARAVARECMAIRNKYIRLLDEVAVRSHHNPRLELQLDVRFGGSILVSRYEDHQSIPSQAELLELYYTNAKFKYKGKLHNIVRTFEGDD